VRSIDAKAKLWTTSWTWTQLEADDVTRQAMDLPALVGVRALLLRALSFVSGQAERRCGNGHHAGTVRGSRDIGECCEAELW
jgi:hypothetical protein